MLPVFSLVLAACAQSVDGGVSESDLQDVIALHADAFQGCFAKKKSSLCYRFTVANTGRATIRGIVESPGLTSAQILHGHRVGNVDVSEAP